MNKRIMKTADSDRLILADSKKLLEHVDLANLECRDSKIVKDLYHPGWFFKFNGEEYLTPPAVYIEDGIIKFINGPHRTVLLSRYLDTFPLLIGNLDMDHFEGSVTEKSTEILNKIMVDNFVEHSIFMNLPELDFGDFPPA